MYENVILNAYRKRQIVIQIVLAAKLKSTFVAILVPNVRYADIEFIKYNIIAPITPYKVDFVSILKRRFLEATTSPYNTGMLMYAE